MEVERSWPAARRAVARIGERNRPALSECAILQAEERAAGTRRSASQATSASHGQAHHAVGARAMDRAQAHLPLRGRGLGDFSEPRLTEARGLKLALDPVLKDDRTGHPGSVASLNDHRDVHMFPAQPGDTTAAHGAPVSRDQPVIDEQILECRPLVSTLMAASRRASSQSKS